ncbi:NUDIX domain-containing protein [bacterium]|nr:NUDIX domain-containing protein [bacterium]
MEAGIDYVGVGVGIAVTDGTGRVCLNLRGAGARDEHGRWDLCGGEVEFGEAPEETVRREMKEEYGCEPEMARFCGVVNSLRRQNGQIKHWIMLMYLVKVDHEQVSNVEPEKHERLAWFVPGDWPENMHSQFANDWATIAPEWDKFYTSLRSSTERTVVS